MSLTVVNINLSDSDTSLDEEPTQLIKKPRVYNKNNWIRKQIFENKSQSDEFLKTSSQWAILRKATTNEGRSQLLYCKIGGKSCPTQIKLVFLSDSQKVEMHSNEKDHRHEKPAKMSTETKSAVNALIRDNIKKPNAILKALKSQGIKVPKKDKVVNYVQYNKSKVQDPVIHLGELSLWCENRYKNAQNNDDIFVIDYDITISEENPSENYFRIFISSNRLLEYTSLSKNLHADSTYKLNYLGFPVMIVGCSDMDKVFHPSGIILSKTENTSDFQFIFNALKQGVETFTEKPYDPEVLIADAAGEITNGFKNVFGETFRVMCWFHVTQAYTKKMDGIKSETKRELNEDIHKIQISPNSSVFKKASELFLTKWKRVKNKNIDTFLKYFKKTWLDKNNGWYAGYVSPFPSTNNSLEATNRVIKDEETLRERLPLGEFLACAEKIVSKWTEERDPEYVNFKKFADTQTISLELETSTFQWLHSKPKILQNNNSTTDYFIGAKCLEIDQNAVESYMDPNKIEKWQNFGDFLNSETTLWKVNFIPTNWKSSECTCPSFFKHYICKHILGIAKMNNLFKIRAIAKNVPIGEKRKRGRPKKAKKALILQ